MSDAYIFYTKGTNEHLRWNKAFGNFDSSYPYVIQLFPIFFWRLILLEGWNKTETEHYVPFYSKKRF